MVLSRDGQRALSLQDCTLTPVEEKDVDLLAGGRELRFCMFPTIKGVCAPTPGLCGPPGSPHGCRTAS